MLMRVSLKPIFLTCRWLICYLWTSLSFSGYVLILITLYHIFSLEPSVPFQSVLCRYFQVCHLLFISSKYNWFLNLLTPPVCEVCVGQFLLHCFGSLFVLPLFLCVAYLFDCPYIFICSVTSKQTLYVPSFKNRFSLVPARIPETLSVGDQNKPCLWLEIPCNSIYAESKYKHTWGPISRYNFLGMVSLIFLLLYLTPGIFLYSSLELERGVRFTIVGVMLCLYCGCSPVGALKIGRAFL